MTTRSNRSFSKLPAIAVLLVLTCALAACGRKAGLDLPPGAAGANAEAPAEQFETPSNSAASTQGDVFQQPSSSGNNGSRGPVAPKGPKKRIPLDAILD